jgi:geranylgeranyl diphosphate synthase, type II
MSPLLNNYQRWLEAAIKKQKYGQQPQSLYQPIDYLMNLGGKRLRPMLALLAYSLYKNDVKTTVRYAVAIEAFHNFTLMHDDIMDKAPLRRGKPTVHEKWNVNTAILSGDVMLVGVYEIFRSLPPEKLSTVLAAFNKCAAQVCEGQQWDMEFESRGKVSEEEYVNMIRLKTAVLLGFSLELGAILANAPLKDRKALRDFGVNVGIGFQLTDDLLDAFADPKKFGKQVGGDIIANKKTFLLIRALEAATGKNKRDLTAWLTTKRFSKKEKVNAVKQIYDRLGIQNVTQKKIDYYFRKGFKSLDKLSVGNNRSNLLRAFTNTLIERQS